MLLQSVLARRALLALLLLLALTALPLTAPAPASAADPGPPATPQAVTARAGVNQAKVYWAAPDPDGPAVEQYVVTSSPEGRTCTAAANARSCVVGGLTNGQPYTFTVAARNAVGDSDPSAPTNEVTPTADRTAPVLVSSSVSPARVSAGGGSVVVELHITDDLSGRAAPSGIFDANPAVLLEKGNSSVGFTRAMTRVSGDEYDGIYRATLTIPAGTASGAWGLVVYPIRDNAGNSTGFLDRPGITVGSPTAPRNVTASAGADRSVAVSWDPPADNGGNVITGYEVTAEPGGRTFQTTATALEASFADWPAAQPLTFTVTALNAGGRSEPSAPSDPVVVPAAAPGAPTVTEVRGADRRLQVSWSAPAATGGDSELTYTATALPGGATCTSTGSSCTIEGLTNGSTYEVSVTAANSAGASAASQALAGTVAAVPAAPPAPRLSVLAGGPSAAAVVVHFSAPTSDGGAPVTGFTATVRTLDGTLASTCTTSVEPYCLLDDLQDGATYAVQAVATNASGDGAPSPVTTWTADLAGPVVTAAGPAWASTLSSKVRIDFRATDATGVAGFGVRTRVLEPGKPVRLVDRSIVEPSYTQRITPGTTLCVSALALDLNRVAGELSNEVCRTAPIDDRSMKRSGRVQRLTGSYFDRTATRLLAKGSALSISKVRADAAQLVVATGRDGGRIGVYYGSKLVKKISLRSQKAVLKKVVALPSLARTTAITVRSLSRKPAVVDGLVLRPR